MPLGPGDVLDLIRSERATTRGDVEEATGLSRMTVAARVSALLADGLIVEGATGRSTGGRQPRSLEFNVDRSRVATIAMDTRHSRLAITDLGGRILADERLEVDVADGPVAALDLVVTAVTTLLHESDLSASDLSGIGISVPGPIDPVSRRPSQPPIMPGWDAYPIGEHLSGGLGGVPVLVANDADAEALGEYAYGHVGAPSLCAVKVSTGIGTGIVIGGRSYQGIDGGAGDIGHVRLAGVDAVCHCGGRGCLAAVASGGAIARALTDQGTPATSARDVAALLAQGDHDATQLTQEAGRVIGEVLTTVVSVLNPGVVLIGGDLASAPLLAGIRESLYRLSLPRATRHLDLRQGALGEDAAIVGLSRMVVDEQFSAAAINRRLG